MTHNDGLFRPEDTAFLVYLAGISVFVTLFHNGVQRWWLYVISHAAGAAAVIFFLRYADKHPHPVIRFFRYWYIPLSLAVFYEQIDRFILGLHGRYLDHLIYDFEKALLGIHPSVWMEQFASPVLTEIMKISYNSYYWIGPILGISLYRKGDLIPFRRSIFTISAAFFISYSGFILFPVVGPRYMLSHLYNGPLDGYFVTALQDFIMEHGDIQGGCMPSSHVAVALVVLLLAWTYRRRMAFWMTPLVTMLCISTVYNRYHYASDVVAGVVVGLAVFLWGKRVYGSCEAAPEGERGRMGEVEREPDAETR
ncbi:MAG: phosphatase PAP2 family protein [bacterium]|nr:phosphatase PAP2 family protein [bacterium]